jgi:ribonuclease HII
MLKITYEKELLKKFPNFDCIVGIDEVGRGSWAGPFVMCAYSIKQPFNRYPELSDVRDSKKLSEKTRETIFKQIKTEIKNKLSQVKLAQISAKYISKHSLKNAIQQSVRQLTHSFNLEKTLFLFDAGIKVPEPGIHYESIKKGDDKVYSIAAAAIYGKVYRDSLMKKLAKKYKNYAFESNVGYGTKQHREAISKHGICPIHRTCYKPLKKYIIQ